MNPFRSLKRLVGMVFQRSAARIFGLSRRSVSWYRSVRDVTDSSTVAVTVMWCARNFPEAPPALWQIASDGQHDQVADHPLLRLLRRPNPFWNGILLWMATVTDWKCSGNAYWIIRRNGLNLPAELWWTPSWLIEPVGDETTYITHYEYNPNGGDPLRIDPSDVVHFRFGSDPENPLKGLSPLRCVLREVYTDDEAARFTATILTNMGVPGIVVSPEKGVELDEEEAALTKAELKTQFGGANRGDPIVMTAATNVSQFGFSPQELMLKEVRRIPEERVSAALGVPAVVVGLGAGLDRSTFTNMSEAREAAYENGLIPDQRILSEVVTWSLLTEFEPDPHTWQFGFDLTKVRVLSEDVYRVVQRHDLAVRGGWEIVAEARRAANLPVEPDRDNVFLRPANYTMVGADPDGSGEITTLKSNTVEQTPQQQSGTDIPGAPQSPANGGGAPPANGNGGRAHVDSAEIAAEVSDAVVAAIERIELSRRDR